MKQAVMTSPGKIEYREIERPNPQDDEVLIRINRIGICGSDIHVFHGLHPYTKYPVVQGHEVSGVVAELGRKVKQLALDDTVVLMPQVTCGECYPCRHGMYNICDALKVMGFQTAGAAQEYFPVKAEKVLRLPASMSMDQGALVEPTSVAMHAIGRAGDIKGLKVLVLGAGTIGNLVAQAATASGATAVMISDVSDYKLEKARHCGIQFVINPQRENLDKAILKNFGPDRADLIIECVGVPATIAQAIPSARKGSTIVVVGVFATKPEVDFGLVQDHELHIIGSLMYQRVDYERAIELVARGKINVNELITHRFPFDHYLDAYHAIEAAQGKYMKVIVDV